MSGRPGEWGGRRPGAGRPRGSTGLRRLQVSVQKTTLDAIRQTSFDRGVSRGEVVDDKFRKQKK